jgi:hypothetical protein
MTPDRLHLWRRVQRHARGPALVDCRVPTAHVDWFVWATLAFGILVILVTLMLLWLAGQP